MTTPHTPGAARVRTGARPARTPLAIGIAAAVLLLATPRPAPSAGPDRPLQLFFRVAAPDTTTQPLPAGTRLLLFAESTGGKQGRNEVPDKIPPGNGARRIVDSIAGVQDGHGVTATSYADSLRYLVIGKVGDTLFWSVNPRNTAEPRYHSVDSIPRIRMAAVPASHRARLDSLFGAGSTQIEETDTTGQKDSDTKDEFIDLKVWELAGVVLGALVLGLLGGLGLAGWMARKGVWPSERVVVPGRGAHPPAYPQGDRKQTWVTYPPEPDRPESKPPDPSLKDQLTELESSICDHVTEQLKITQGEILRHFESGGGRFVTPPATGLTRSGGRGLSVEAERDVHQGHDARSGSDGFEHYGRMLNEVDLGSSASLGAPSTRTEERGVSSQAAEAFVSWCQTAGGNVSKMRDFAEVMASRVAGSEVYKLVRDRDSNAVTFVVDGAGDPIEYWLVSARGENMLFPRPLNQKTFRELHPVYEGEAGPLSLRSIQPASVRQDGGRWVLASPGRVS